MQVLNVKHKPVTISSMSFGLKSFPSELEAAVHSKLSNELLELEEFRKLALQKLSEILQQAEKELLETAEKVIFSISEACENASRDLSNALSFINLRHNSSNFILDMFNTCTSTEEVREKSILYKSLEYKAFNVAKLVNSSVFFNLEITDTPTIPSHTSVILEKLKMSSDSIFCRYNSESNQKAIDTCLKLDETAPVFKIANSNIELKSLKPSSKHFNRLSRTYSLKSTENLSQSPCIYNFLQNTNKIAWYNIEKQTWHEHGVPNHIFLKDSAWSLCEGGKLMITGGYEFQAKDHVFLFDLNSKIEEKASNMPNKRCKHAQVSLGNYVYVIGGVGNSSCLKSVDKFNLYRKKWKKTGNMNFCRENPAACSHERKIYIVGGIGCCSIEIYDPFSRVFILTNIKISSPGISCIFSYDDHIIILKGDSLTKFIPRSMTTIEKQKVLYSDWIMNGEPFITHNSCYFFFMEELFKLDLLNNSVNLIGKLP